MKLLIFIIFFLPVAGITQQIKSNTVDGFTGERTIVTSIVSLKTAYTTGLGIYLSSVGAHYLVNIVGYGEGIGDIRKTDFVYFLMEDGLILTGASIGNQPANDGGFKKVYQHHYLLRYKDVKDLAAKKATLLRITTFAGNRDITLSKRNSKEIQKLAVVFLKEASKHLPGQAAL